MKVLFNADDFGLTEGVTDGIIKAHTDGVVGSTTMMMNGNCPKYAVEAAKKLPSLKVGVHLVLTYGKAVHDDVPSLVDENNLFRLDKTYIDDTPPDLDEVEKEWKTQIEAFLATGLPLHHIDSHHHIHGWEPLKEMVVRLAHKYGVPVRYADTLQEHPEILLTDILWTGFYGDGVGRNIFEKLRDVEAGSVEVMTHPAIMDADLRQISSYNMKRQEELDILCSLDLPDWVRLVK